MEKLLIVVAAIIAAALLGAKFSPQPTGSSLDGVFSPDQKVQEVAYGQQETGSKNGVPSSHQQVQEGIAYEHQETTPRNVVVHTDNNFSFEKVFLFGLLLGTVFFLPLLTIIILDCIRASVKQELILIGSFVAITIGFLVGFPYICHIMFGEEPPFSSHLMAIIVFSVNLLIYVRFFIQEYGDSYGRYFLEMLSRYKILK